LVVSFSVYFKQLLCAFDAAGELGNISFIRARSWAFDLAGGFMPNYSASDDQLLLPVVSTSAKVLNLIIDCQTELI